MSEETPATESGPPEIPPTPAPEAVPQPVPATPSSVYSKAQIDKKLVSGILAIVVGWLGVHKFYLGYTMEGVIMLVVGLAGLFICGFPTMAVGIVGLIEGILYLTKTDDEFVSTYVVGRKGWF